MGSCEDNIKLMMTVFWDDAPCSLVETDPRLRGTTYCLYLQGLMSITTVLQFTIIQTRTASQPYETKTKKRGAGNSSGCELRVVYWSRERCEVIKQMKNCAFMHGVREAWLPTEPTLCSLVWYIASRVGRTLWSALTSKTTQGKITDELYWRKKTRKKDANRGALMMEHLKRR
jgi:hypothetical protein